MALTTTTGANAIREAYAPGFEEAVFRNSSLFSLFPAPSPAVGDTSYRWKLNSAGNSSSEIFTEGLAQPNPGNQSWVNAAVDWTYVRIMLQVTGHARDALKSNWVNAVQEEMLLGQADLVDLWTTTMMGSTAGIELAVDYGSAYAGITRNGSAGYFEATETAVGGAVSVADLQDLRETIRDNDKAGRPDLIICPENQATRIYNLSGGPAVQQIGDRDKSPGLVEQYFAGMRIVPLPDWTDTVIMMLDRRPGNWSYPVIRPFSVKEMAPAGDSEIFQLSFGGQLICRQPRFQGKLTGCTA